MRARYEIKDIFPNQSLSILGWHNVHTTHTPTDAPTYLGIECTISLLVFCKQSICNGKDGFERLKTKEAVS